MLLLCDSTGRVIWKLAPDFLWPSLHVPFPFAGFALYSFTLWCDASNLWVLIYAEHLSPPGKSSNLGWPWRLLTSLGIYLEVAFLGSLLFWATNYTPHHLHRFTFPPALFKYSNFSPFLPTLVILCFLFNAVYLMGVKCYLIDLYFSSSDDAEHLMSLSAICTRVFEKCLFKSLAGFLNWVAFSLLRCRGVFTYSGYHTLIKYLIWKYFLPFFSLWPFKCA